jgi:hypothetical protein
MDLKSKLVQRGAVEIDGVLHVPKEWVLRESPNLPLGEYQRGRNRRLKRLAKAFLEMPKAGGIQ